MKTVLLENGTVGTTGDAARVGDIVKVDLCDENGNPITDRGVVAEVLESGE